MEKYDVYYAKLYLEEDRKRFTQRPAVYLHTTEDGRHVFLKITHTERTKFGMRIKDHAAAGLKDYAVKDGEKIYAPSYIEPLNVRVLEPSEVLNYKGHLSKDDQVALDKFIEERQHVFTNVLHREMER